ncbi:hypothetical protein NT6N_30360 [Oceaniferula spumae]|uniref:Entericidin A/B family lipoprotein n=1 Tax=Oceaniferula spumae TaxID=2979115 RepID=A0AAT9FQ26_9BACT
MKHITTIILAIGGLAALTLTSCNAVAGAGQDIQQGGAALQGAAHRAAH